jgi:3-oxoacyl-[acyl-carrier protein] reductase
VEVLVANAGVTADGLIVRMGDAQWDNVLRTNLDGAFIAVRRAAARMMRARWGRIVAVSSVAGSAGSAGQANYAAAKAGLVGLMRSVARELASRNVTANVVEPGPITTATTCRTRDARSWPVRCHLAASARSTRSRPPSPSSAPTRPPS